MKHPLFLICLLLVGIGSCSTDEKKQNLNNYYFRFPGPEAPEGATVVFGKLQLGQVHSGFDAGRFELRNVGYAWGRLPEEEFIAAREHDLALVFNTPCGRQKRKLLVRHDVPVTPYKKAPSWSSRYERKARERNPAEVFVPVQLDSSETIPTTSELFIDRHGAPDTPISIGQLQLPAGEEKVAVTGLDCAPQHDIKVAGEVIGQFKRDPKVGAYLLSIKPEQCYRFSRMEYLRPGQPSSGEPTRLLLRGGPVYPLPPYSIVHFLSAAGSASSVTGWTTELVRVDCPR